MEEILTVVDDLDKKLKELYYLCDKHHVKVSVDLDTIHYSLHSKIKPNIEELIEKSKIKENKENVI